MRLRQVLHASSFALFALTTLASREALASDNASDADDAASAGSATPSVQQKPLQWPGSDRTHPRYFAQQYPPQQYPPQQQYPQQQGGYPPQQQYPQQQGGYPPQQQFPQQQFPQQQFPQQQFPQQQANPNPENQRRNWSEMPFLYGAALGYGIGMGVWIDSLAKVTDPGLALIAPTLLGAGGLVGVLLWDELSTIHRGVPTSTATGTTLGFGLGIGLNLLQWQLTSPSGQWDFKARTSLTLATTTVGAVGGYLFGEFVRPDPRSVAFIASGTGWGAMSGFAIGAGATVDNFDSVKTGMAVGGLIGYGVGTAGAGLLSFAWTPSMQSQKWMWAGYGAGVLASGLVYPLYLLGEGDARHGLVFTGLAGLVGTTIAAIATYNFRDDEDSGVTRTGKANTWTPPFQLGFAPQTGGGMMTAFGQF